MGWAEWEADVRRAEAMAKTAGKAPLTYNTEDSAGMTGKELLGFIGSRWKHTGNEKTYVVLRIVWDAAKDLWALGYQEGGYSDLPGVECQRDHVNFFGERKTGVRRFVRP